MTYVEMQKGGKTIDILINQKNVEPLFKVYPPFTESGRGYKGVVLRHKKDDTLHCHECGAWVDHLPSHAWNKHKIKGKEYRIKHGLPMLIPLVSKDISRRLSVQSKQDKVSGRIKKYRWEKGQPQKKGQNNAKYARNNASFRNKHRACEVQLYERYLLVAEQVGRDPSERDFYKYDPKWIEIVKNRYKSINKFKVKFGFEQYEFKTARKWSKDEIITRINQYFEARAIAPKMSDIAVPENIINKFFGSFEQALKSSPYFG